MKFSLTNKEIRDAHNAFTYLGKVELEAFIPISMNMVELEPKAKQVTDFVLKVAKKIGTPHPENKDMLTYNTKEFDDNARVFMEKKHTVDLEVINIKQLVPPEGIKIAGDLIAALIRMKIVVK